MNKINRYSVRERELKQKRENKSAKKLLLQKIKINLFQSEHITSVDIKEFSYRAPTLEDLNFDEKFIQYEINGGYIMFVLGGQKHSLPMQKFPSKFERILFLHYN